MSDTCLRDVTPLLTTVSAVVLACKAKNAHYSFCREESTKSSLARELSGAREELNTQKLHIKTLERSMSSVSVFSLIGN